jgi:hypothetical protein
VIDGQLRGSVGGTQVARTPVAALTTPRAENAGAEPLPGPRAVQRVVAASVGLPGVERAATTSAARQDAADRADLHSTRGLRGMRLLTLVTLEYTPVDIAMSVIRGGVWVYSPPVLRLRAHSSTRCAMCPVGHCGLRRSCLEMGDPPGAACYRHEELGLGGEIHDRTRESGTRYSAGGSAV